MPVSPFGRVHRSLAGHPVRAALVAVVAGTVLAGAAGCSTTTPSTAASGASSAASSAGAAAAPSGEQADGKAGAAAPPTTADAGAPAGTASQIQQRVVRTAQVGVRVRGDLGTAAATVRAVALSLGGSVASETTTFADAAAPGARPGGSVLVLRVPAADLDRALTLITGPSGAGTELTRSSTAEDVTGDLADLQSRVATQRASVTRVRALLARATSLQDVVLLEGELTKRQAELDAASARQAALADRADLATLTVELSTTAPPAAPRPRPGNPFLHGLSGGWHALGTSTAVVLTVLGAVLPVGVVLAVLAVPALWWWRRRRGSAATPVAPVPDTP